MPDENHQPVRISGSLLTRNWIWNLAGQGLPLLVGLFTIPYLIRGLGTERFGILSLAWVVLGYVGLLDLGLGRATTKFVAECLGKGDVERLPGIVWSSLACQMIFGTLGTLLMGGVTVELVDRWLKISPALVGEARMAFLIIAASLPVVLATNALRGVLEATQQFDLVNYVKIPANASVFILPALAVLVGLRLPGIIFLLVLARLGATLAYLFACFRSLPILRHRFAFDLHMVRPMFAYGGWVTVSSVLSPLMMYIDRFFIGSLVSMSAVAYYTAPYEAITRAWILPGSLMGTLFPAFTNLDASGGKAKLEQLYARAVKSLLLILAPLVLLVITFAHELLRAWLGADFAAHSAPILQILAVGVLINCLAFVPLCLLQGLGHPNVTAKFHLWELPFYAVALWLLLPRMGVAGAALAWTLRVTADACLLFGSVFRRKFVSIMGVFDKSLRKTALILLLFGASLGISLLLPESLFVKATIAILFLLVLPFSVWSYGLDGRERSLLMSAAGQIRVALRKG